MAYTYTNSMYEPRIRDFDDDYHLPDPEEVVEFSLLAQVKKIRRRYNNWFDYVDACNLYDEYMAELIDSYGGMKKFKLAALMGVVREYIPNYPELKKTRRNRFFVKHRMSRESMVGEPNFDDDANSDIVFDNEVDESKIKVKLVDDKDINSVYNTGRRHEDSASNVLGICRDLDILNAYYHQRLERINAMKGSRKKKDKLRASLNRKQLRLGTNYRSLTDMINIHDKRVRDRFMNKDNSAQSMIAYKGRIVSSSDTESYEVLSKLKQIGVKLTHLSKAQTKLIRKKKEKPYEKMSKKERKKLRKKQKKNDKMDAKFISDFTGSDYENWIEFEESMLDLTGSRRWD